MSLRSLVLTPLGRCSIFGSLLGATALAQSTASTTTDSPTSEKALVLAAFEVRSAKDYGYRATNSMVATGFGTEIYDTPISISVITKDLINDLSAWSLRESLLYTSSVTTDARDPNQTTGRGFRVPIQVNRLTGFVRNPSSDFIERIDLVKGPNSVFFGRVAPGGLLNMTTLTAKARTETVLKLSGGSYDFGKVVLDHNQAVTNNFFLRVAGAYTNCNDGFSDWTYREETAGYATFLWKPIPKLTISGNYQRSSSRENVVVSGSRTNSRYLQNGNSAISIQEWGAANVPANTPFITELNESVMFPNGRRGNNNGPEAYKADRLSAGQLQITDEVADWLSLRFDGGWSVARDDSFVVSGFVRPNGDIVQRGNRYADGTPAKDAIAQLEAAFTFDLGPTHHRLLAGGRYFNRDIRSFFISGNLVTQNFFTMGPRLLVSTFGQTDPAVLNAYLYTVTADKAYYAVDQIDFFSGRLKLLAGARNAAITNKRTATNANERTQRQTTPQFGAWFELAKDAALFVNYSRTFEPQYNIDAFGQVADNVEGEGKEIGFKTSFRDNLLSGTISLYEVTRKGEVRRDFLREQATNIIPQFIPGGDQRSRGLELELTYTPTRNYQAIVNWSHITEAKVIKDTTSPWLVGRRLALAPENSAAFWNRYAFVNGAFKGLFVGGGVRYSSKTATILDSSISVDTPAYTVVDAVLGYETRFRGKPVRYQLNVKNLLNEEYYDGRWVPADPLTVYFSAEFRF